MTMKYGCIDEDILQLRSPRGIERDEHDSLRGAFNEAIDLIVDDGVLQVAIVRCHFAARYDAWVEIPDMGCITIDATAVRWLREEDENA